MYCKQLYILFFPLVTSLTVPLTSLTVPLKTKSRKGFGWNIALRECNYVVFISVFLPYLWKEEK